MPAYEEELAVAIEAVHESAGLCRGVQASIGSGVLQKADRSPVTIADFGSQALICRRLEQAFPGDQVVAEESSAALREPGNGVLLSAVVEHVRSVQPAANRETVCAWIDRGAGDACGSRFWTLDPIDGTKGFLRGQQYAIALALIVEGEVVVSALCCPNLPVRPSSNLRGSIFGAIRGQGVRTVALDSPETPVRVATSRQTNPAEARFCESVESGHTAHGDAAAVADVLGIRHDSVRLDSQAKYAVVARGEADIYMRLPVRPGYVEKIWDHAAGMLLITEAGGRVSDVAGKPLDFAHGRGLAANRGVIATNGPLHDRVIQALAEVGVS